MHYNPDGDALGSSLALWDFLNNAGHDVRAIAPSDYPNFLRWMPGESEVVHFKKKEKLAIQLVEEAEIIFCLDFNKLSRLNVMQECVDRSTAFFALVDHHIDPDGFADFMLHDAKASSTAELIYQLLVELAGKEVINENIASCLYTGIMTDTGSFRFPSTTPETHLVAAHLIESGANPDTIYNLVNNSFSEFRLRFFGHCLINKMKILPEYKTAYIYVDRKELGQFRIGSGDLEGLVNFPLMMRDIQFAALITDRIENIRLSLRSKGEFDVNLVARQHFNGGGHKNAAGGKTTEKLEQTVERFETMLPNYKSLLNP